MKVNSRLFVTVFSVLLFVGQAGAQRENWSRPFEGFQIIGNLYGVGSYDLSVFLITTDEGHVLINTGLENKARPTKITTVGMTGITRTPELLPH